MGWLAFIFAVELGGYAETFGYSDHEWLPYTDLTVGAVVLDTLTIEGDVQTFSRLPDGGWNFSPIRADYTLLVTLRRGAFSGGYEHLCVHRVETSVASPYRGMIGGMDRLFLRYEHRP